MSRYLILGNGFDIAHNLPTSYKDFLYICASIANVEFDDQYDENKKEMMNRMLDLFQTKYKNSFDKSISNNSWINYFFTIYKTTGKKWVDFEREIKKVCEACNSLGEERRIKKEHEIFESDINIGEYDLYKMKRDLEELIEIFNKYLLILPYDNLDTFYEEIVNFMPTDIISFNYTNTYNKMYNENLKIDYVHGKMSEQYNTIVLGFDSMDDDLADVKFGEFIKYFQMVEKDVKLFSYINIQEIKSKDKDFNEAMFFGHSLDKTDADVVKNIIDSVGWVYIVFYNTEHKKQMIKNLIEIYGRNEFINLTLSNKKKIIFVKQSSGKALLKQKNVIKDLIKTIYTINFKECSCETLKNIINNENVKLGYLALKLLLNKLENTNELVFDYFSNYEDLKDILESEIEKLKINE